MTNTMAVDAEDGSYVGLITHEAKVLTGFNPMNSYFNEYHYDNI